MRLVRGRVADQDLVKSFSGKWLLQVKFKPSSEMPKGFDGNAEKTWHPRPGGYTLLEEERLPLWPES